MAVREIGLLLAALCLLAVPALGAQALYSDDMRSVAAWKAMPDWLGNPSAAATLTRVEGAARFAVPEAGRGMKWLRAVSGVWLVEAPWLVVRYRAAGLEPKAEYFLWLQAGDGLEALRLDQLQADGQWHTIAVEVGGLAPLDQVGGMAVQVQAGQAEGWVEIAAISFMESPPAEAAVVGGSAAPASDWELAGHRQGDWQAQPNWLANPAQQHRHQRRGGTDRFQVAQASRGMKWSLAFDQPVAPAGYRYLSLRLRGRGLVGGSDYTLCVLGETPSGSEYTVLLGQVVADGRWRQLELPLGAARRHALLAGLAVQAQAGAGPAELEIAEVRLTCARRPQRLADLVEVRAGWGAGAADHYTPINLGRATRLGAGEAQARFRLADWFGGERVTVEGVPFRVGMGSHALLPCPEREESETRLYLSGRASEVYLLVVARLLGGEQHLFGGGLMQRLADVDRLAVALEYADGERRQALPARVGSPGYGLEEGVQVLVVPADPRRELRRLSLYLGTRQARVGIAAATLGTGRPRFAARWGAPGLPTARQVGAAPSKPVKPQAILENTRLLLENRHLQARFDLDRQAGLGGLVHRALGARCVAGPASPLFAVGVGKDAAAQAAFSLESATLLPDGSGAWLTYRSSQPALEVAVSLSVGEQPRLSCQMSVRNLDQGEVVVWPRGPHFLLAIGRPQDMWYLIPASASILSCRPIDYSAWYSGAGVSLQFLDAYSPRLGGGACLLVRDLESREKCYRLRKSGSGVAMELAYQQRSLAPGETYQLPPVDLWLHTGDWRAAWGRYREWSQSWYRPLAPRPQWWREVFNFRQRFLYWLDPMVEEGGYRLGAALAEAEREFGGCEYLHLFDWGNCGPHGRIYGRTGDYDPGDYLPGGWEGLQAAVAGVRQRGVRVGYYIEGYLLDERGKLGRAYGPDWQMADAQGYGLRWPGSSEIYICPGVAAWQEVQASTYARMVQRMDADGMYLDEFGFTGPGKWCWSQDHGHPVPSSSLQCEQALTRRVREAMSAIKPEAVLYTEDTPTDVNSQYQEGAFCYSMQRHREGGSVAPLKLFRFAFPDFKNIEILDCDHPTGAWATGVRWAFWNGEALWLEGMAREWFAPQTRRAIRECHRVLRAHRGAFAGTEAEPLVPTLAPGVFANRFTGGGETAYTLYHAGLATYAGEVLSLPQQPGMRYFDAFAERELTPRLAGGRAVLSLVLDPQGVGCIVCRREE